MIRAILSDCDYTVWDRKTGEVYPSAKERLRALPSHVHKVFCTNQPGVGFHYWAKKEGWGDPKRWKGERAIRNRYRALMQQGLGISNYRLYFSFRARGSNGAWGPAENDKPEWSPEWRKPCGGMLRQAMKDLGLRPEDCVYIGDDQDDDHPDSGAAADAGIPFLRAPAIWADEVFWRGFYFQQEALFDLAVAGKRETNLSNLIDSPRRLTTAEALANLSRIVSQIQAGEIPEQLPTHGGREGAQRAAQQAIAENVLRQVQRPSPEVKKRRRKR